MKRIGIPICIIAILLLSFAVYRAQSYAQDYANAVSMMESGEYTSAIDIFDRLGDYDDSKEQLKICKKLLADQESYNAAVAAYNIAIQDLANRTSQLDALISEAETLISSEEPALDPTLIAALEAAILEARTNRAEFPGIPEETQAISDLTIEIEGIDYTDITAKLTEALQNAKTSIAQYALVNIPTEEYVIQCISNVPGVTGIGPVTEKNDPNGKLNKDGGYIACVFFSHELVTPNPMSESAVINSATRGGGCIEVYTTAEDAIKRDTYLSAFNGTVLDPGSHCVIGTVVVRTSCKLTASQQKELESNIINILTKVEI